METVDNEVVDVVWARPDGQLTGPSLRPTLDAVPHAWTECSHPSFIFCLWNSQTTRTSFSPFFVIASFSLLRLRVSLNKLATNQLSAHSKHVVQSVTHRPIGLDRTERTITNVVYSVRPSRDKTLD